jgi:FkbM family methyltransferase
LIVEATVINSKEENWQIWESILTEVNYHKVWFDGLRRTWSCVVLSWCRQTSTTGWNRRVRQIETIGIRPRFTTAADRGVVLQAGSTPIAVLDCRGPVSSRFAKDVWPMDHLQRHSVLMRDRHINLVLDIGANKGQYGMSLRQTIGYRGRIISFEPLRDAFAILQRAAAADPLWECHNIAFGDCDGTATINISANSHSSSLLPASARTLKIESSVGYVGTQKIVVHRLDTMLDQFARPDDNIFLKVDTQGYELKILNGALGVINRFALIQLETSFFEVYQGETLIGDMLKILDYIGYRVVSIEPGWEDPVTGELLQADFIFGRKSNS